jgi:hypothetical protein
LPPRECGLRYDVHTLGNIDWRVTSHIDIGINLGPIAVPKENGDVEGLTVMRVPTHTEYATGMLLLIH